MSGFETLLIATAIGGTVLETIGNVQQAEEDRKIARANAAIVQAEASEEARLEAAEGRRITAAARVRAAASGMSVDGSALDVIGELAAEGELRSRSAIYRGQVRYDNFRMEESAAKRRKVAAIASGVGKMGTTLLTSGMSMGGAPAAPAGTGSLSARTSAMSSQMSGSIRAARGGV